MTVWDEITRELRRRWSERLADDIRRWQPVILFNPAQDAPALGYLPSLREYIGAVDATPPTFGGLPDPVADLVRQWRRVDPKWDTPQWRWMTVGGADLP